MAPPVSFTKSTLSYPIVAASFDPYRNYLVVGGGGGAGRSGVANKITALDVSSRSEITTAAEIELSRDEDSVTTVATLAQKDGIIAFAGINSSEASLAASKNEHFRSFEIKLPSKSDGAEKVAQGSVELLGKTQLFTSPTKKVVKTQAYQRVIRLSRPRKNATAANKRIGAIASGLAGEENEVIIFDATVAQPSTKDTIQRITPHNGAEANDIDMLEGEDSEFKVAYCTDHEVYVSDVKYDFAKKAALDATAKPRAVYTIPQPSGPSKIRPRLRSLRWLSPSHILLTVNLPKQTGVELRILRLYSSHTLGAIATTTSLPRHVKASVDLDTAELNADEKGAHQIVVAVAGNDQSISVFTIDYRGPEKDSFGNLKSATVLRDVHPMSITKVVVQPFHSPWSSDPANTKTPGPQYLRIASTSISNTVVVDTFSLTPKDAKKHGSPYILYTGNSHYIEQSASVIVLGFVLLVGLLLFQSYITAKSGPENSIQILPERLSEILGQFRPAGDRSPRNFPAPDPPAKKKVPQAKVRHALRDLLPHRRNEHLDAHLEDKAIVVSSAGDHPDLLETEIHHDPEELEADSKLKRWEELSQHEKEVWKERLSKAGQWAHGEGETVLKGVFFSELAGFVGRAAAEALHG